MGLMSFNTFAQKQVTIKAGTIVPLQSVRQVKVRAKAWCLNAFALTGRQFCNKCFSRVPLWAKSFLPFQGVLVYYPKPI